MSNVSPSRTAFLVLAAAAAPVLLAVLSCSQTPRQQYQAELARTEEPALHAVHDDRLRELMHELDNLALKRLPQELDPETKHGPHARQVADIAASMADAADRIRASSATIELDDDEREVFNQLASTLRSQSMRLELSARDNDLPRMQQDLDQITTTCNACHSAFRAVPPLEE